MPQTEGTHVGGMLNRPKKKPQPHPQPLGVGASVGAGTPSPQAVAPSVPIDFRIRNIVTGYHMATGRIPSAKKIADTISSTPPDTTAEEYHSTFAVLANPNAPPSVLDSVSIGDIPYMGGLLTPPSPGDLALFGIPAQGQATTPQPHHHSGRVPGGIIQQQQAAGQRRQAIAQATADLTPSPISPQLAAALYEKGGKVVASEPGAAQSIFGSSATGQGLLGWAKWIPGGVAVIAAAGGTYAQTMWDRNKMVDAVYPALRPFSDLTAYSGDAQDFVNGFLANQGFSGEAIDWVHIAQNPTSIKQGGRNRYHIPTPLGPTRPSDPQEMYRNRVAAFVFAANAASAYWEQSPRALQQMQDAGVVPRTVTNFRNFVQSLGLDDEQIKMLIFAESRKGHPLVPDADFVNWYVKKSGVGAADCLPTEIAKTRQSDSVAAAQQLFSMGFWSNPANPSAVLVQTTKTALGAEKAVAPERVAAAADTPIVQQIAGVAKWSAVAAVADKTKWTENTLFKAMYAPLGLVEGASAGYADAVHHAGFWRGTTATAKEFSTMQSIVKYMTVINPSTSALGAGLVIASDPSQFKTDMQRGVVAGWRGQTIVDHLVRTYAGDKVADQWAVPIFIGDIAAMTGMADFCDIATKAIAKGVFRSKPVEAFAKKLSIQPNCDIHANISADPKVYVGVNSTGRVNSGGVSFVHRLINPAIDPETAVGWSDPAINTGPKIVDAYESYNWHAVGSRDGLPMHGPAITASLRWNKYMDPSLSPAQRALHLPIDTVSEVDMGYNADVTTYQKSIFNGMEHGDAVKWASTITDAMAEDQLANRNAELGAPHTHEFTQRALEAFEEALDAHYNEPGSASDAFKKSSGDLTATKGAEYAAWLNEMKDIRGTKGGDYGAILPSYLYAPEFDQSLGQFVEKSLIRDPNVMRAITKALEESESRLAAIDSELARTRPERRLATGAGFQPPDIHSWYRGGGAKPGVMLRDKDGALWRINQDGQTADALNADGTAAGPTQAVDGLITKGTTIERRAVNLSVPNTAAKAPSEVYKNRPLAPSVTPASTKYIAKLEAAKAKIQSAIDSGKVSSEKGAAQLAELEPRLAKAKGAAPAVSAAPGESAPAAPIAVRRADLLVEKNILADRRARLIENASNLAPSKAAPLTAQQLLKHYNWRTDTVTQAIFNGGSKMRTWAKYNDYGVINQWNRLKRRLILARIGTMIGIMSGDDAIRGILLSMELHENPFRSWKSYVKEHPELSTIIQEHPFIRQHLSEALREQSTPATVWTVVKPEDAKAAWADEKVRLPLFSAPNCPESTGVWAEAFKARAEALTGKPYTDDLHLTAVEVDQCADAGKTALLAAARNPESATAEFMQRSGRQPDPLMNALFGDESVQWTNAVDDVARKMAHNDIARKHLFGGATAVNEGDFRSLPVRQAYGEVQLPAEGENWAANHSKLYRRSIGLGIGISDGMYRLLDAMSEAQKRHNFGLFYHDEMEFLRNEVPSMTPKEMEGVATNRATMRTATSTYFGTHTLLDHNIRNLVMFLPAYKDFFKFWIPQMAKNPFKSLVAMMALQQLGKTHVPEQVPILGGYTTADLSTGVFLSAWAHPGKVQGWAPPLTTVTDLLEVAGIVGVPGANTLYGKLTGGYAPGSISTLFQRQLEAVIYGVTGSTLWAGVKADVNIGPAHLHIGVPSQEQLAESRNKQVLERMQTQAMQNATGGGISGAMDASRALDAVAATYAVRAKEGAKGVARFLEPLSLGNVSPTIEFYDPDGVLHKLDLQRIKDASYAYLTAAEADKKAVLDAYPEYAPIAHAWELTGEDQLKYLSENLWIVPWVARRNVTNQGEGGSAYATQAERDAATRKMTPTEYAASIKATYQSVAAYILRTDYEGVVKDATASFNAAERKQYGPKYAASTQYAHDLKWKLPGLLAKAQAGFYREHRKEIVFACNAGSSPGQVKLDITKPQGTSKDPYWVDHVTVASTDDMGSTTAGGFVAFDSLMSSGDPSVHDALASSPFMAKYAVLKAQKIADDNKRLVAIATSYHKSDLTPDDLLAIGFKAATLVAGGSLDQGIKGFLSVVDKRYRILDKLTFGTSEWIAAYAAGKQAILGAQRQHGSKVTMLCTADILHRIGIDRVDTQTGSGAGTRLGRDRNAIVFRKAKQVWDAVDAKTNVNVTPGHITLSMPGTIAQMRKLRDSLPPEARAQWNEYIRAFCWKATLMVGKYARSELTNMYAYTGAWSKVKGVSIDAKVGQQMLSSWRKWTKDLCSLDNAIGGGLFTTELQTYSADQDLVKYLIDPSR